MTLSDPPALLRHVLPVLACVLIPLGSEAQTYYLSSSGGSDVNDGFTPATALRTVAKLNTLALKPGDSVLFRRGDIFTGEISAKRGAAGRPVVYAAYGTGGAPVIDGSVRIASSGWSVHSGSIHVKSGVTLPAMTDAEPPILFLNGDVLTPARYPEDGWRTAQSATGGNQGSHCCEFTLTFTDSTLGARFPDPVALEGTHVTAYDAYGVSTRRIRSYAPGTGQVAVDTLRGASLLVHKMYFLSAGLAYLDRPGEWHYDAAAKRLYVWFPDGIAPGADDTLSYNSSLYGINAWEVDDIGMHGLEFRRQKIAGILLVRSDRVSIAECAFHDMKHGLILWGTDGPPEVRNREARIERCEFRRTFRTGINSRNLEECAIRDNVFRGIGLVNALGQSGAPDKWGGYGYWEYGTAVQASGINSVIERNRFAGSGKPALSAGGPGVLIRHNVIDSACVNYNDCGAIMPLGWSRVERNIVRHSVGPFPDFGSTGARGIYPDFRVEDTIRENTVIDTRNGIGLTNSKSELVQNNTVYGSHDVQFRMNKKTAGALDNTVAGNIFFGLAAEQYSLFWDNQTSERDASAIDSNRYWNPYVGFPTIKQKKDSASSEGWYSLATWQTTGYDRHSSGEFIAYASEYRVTDTTGTSLVSNGTFESGTGGWAYADSLTTVTGVLDGACARVKKNSTGQKILSTVLTRPLDTARTYLARFTIADPSNIGRVNIRVKRNGGAYETCLNRWFLTKTARRDYWTVFKPTVPGIAKLEFASSNSVYWIDNVALFPVAATWIDPKDAFPIFVNDGDTPKTISLGGRCYRDLDSALVSGDFVLPPYSSRILVALDTCAQTGVRSAPTPRTPKIAVYPNPARSGSFCIALSDPDQRGLAITVFDAIGRPVWSRSNPEAFGIVHEVRNLRSGLYHVAVMTTGGLVAETVIVLP